MEPFIAKIYFPLPFYLPIDTVKTYVIDLSTVGTFRFKFETFKNESLKAASELEEVCTLIKTEFSPVGGNKEITREIVDSSVQHSIIALNNFLDALRLKSGLESIRNFTITDLPPIIPIEIGEAQVSFITIPKLIETDNGLITEETFKDALQMVGVWYENPYLEVIDKFLSRGVHHLFTEQFTFAIVELNTSFETYIRLCHRLILTKQGKSEVEIENAMSFPFKNTIQDHLGKHLNENLNFDQNPIIKEWYENLYTVRNKIVHSGHSYISGDDAYAAYDALQKVVNYLTELMTREGYVEENGRFLISGLNKNTPDNVDREKVFQRLKERGLLDFMED